MKLNDRFTSVAVMASLLAGLLAVPFALVACGDSDSSPAAVGEGSSSSESSIEDLSSCSVAVSSSSSAESSSEKVRRRDRCVWTFRNSRLSERQRARQPQDLQG